MKGLVMRSTGSFYNVLTDDGALYNCRVRGKIRLEGIKETNPVAVGDHVEFDLENAVGSITTILPRQNHILRQSVKKTGHSHVLAANIDQALLVVTLAFPRTSLGFIDRFLVSAESFRIPQVIVFNKRDMLDDEGEQTVNDLLTLYRNIGVTCFSVSAAHDDLNDVKNILEKQDHAGSGAFRCRQIYLAQQDRAEHRPGYRQCIRVLFKRHAHHNLCRDVPAAR